MSGTLPQTIAPAVVPRVDPAVMEVRLENAGILALQTVVQDIRQDFPQASKQTPIVLGEKSPILDIHRGR